MRTLQELINTPRMFDLPLSEDNSIGGLIDLIKDVYTPNAILLEYGSFAGVSTDLFARFFKGVVAVDIWHFEEFQEMEIHRVQKAYEMFTKMRAEHQNIVTVINDANDTFAKSFFKVEVVYIDAVHDYEYVKRNIETLFPLIKTGGWLCGHDITFDGVKKAVEEKFGTNYKTYKDTSWAVKV